MVFKHKSRVAEIEDIQTGIDLRDIVESGLEFANMLSLNSMTRETFPELAFLTRDVRDDLEKINDDGKTALISAYKKLDWYFTRSPMAGLTTEDEVISYIGTALEGAYDINPDTITEAHIGMYELYTKLKPYIKAIKKEAPDVMYR